MYINVVATATEEHEVVAYAPLKLFLKPVYRGWLSGRALATLVAFSVAFLVVVSIALLMRKKATKMERKLEFELKDVRNVANIETEDDVEARVERQKQEKFARLVEVGDQKEDLKEEDD